MNIKQHVFILIILYSSFAAATEVDATICRSDADETVFKALAKGKVKVLAVCPKKGIYFVEVRSSDEEMKIFQNYILASNLKVTKITGWKEKIEIGSKIIMVEFEY